MFYRHFSLLFQDIILVGCGGTGSRVIAPLIQTIKQAQMKINPCLYLVDGDIFETKNLARQNCISKDIGRNKAIVMAERYGAALDFPVAAHPEMINAHGSMFSEISDSARGQDIRPLLSTRKLIIMCVDNINARLLIINQAGPNDIIIDAGNEDTYGQVSIFDKISIPHLPIGDPEVSNVKPFSGEFELPYIPAPLTPYLNAIVNPPVATGSCADLDQSLAINNMMASGIINMVQNLAYNNPFYYRTQYYDLIKGNSSERMTNTWFNQVWNETTEYSNRHIENYTRNFIRLQHEGSTRYTALNNILDDINANVKFIDPALLAALGK